MEKNHEVKIPKLKKSRIPGIKIPKLKKSRIPGIIILTYLVQKMPNSRSVQVFLRCLSSFAPFFEIFQDFQIHIPWYFKFCDSSTFAQNKNSDPEAASPSQNFFSCKKSTHFSLQGQLCVDENVLLISFEL